MVSISPEFGRGIAALSRVAALCVLVVACGEYAHTNPYDPATKVTIVIHGPDSAHSLHETLSFTYQIAPDWAGVVPVWLSGNDAILGATGPGQFQVNGVGTVDVSLSAGPHTGHHQVVVIQRPKHALFCYFTSCPSSLALGGVATLNLVQTDSLGTALLSSQAPAQVQYDVHPAGILQIVSASPLSVQVKAIGSGTAYVIAALGASLDSVAVSAR